MCMHGVRACVRECVRVCVCVRVRACNVVYMLVHVFTAVLVNPKCERGLVRYCILRTYPTRTHPFKFLKKI